MSMHIPSRRGGGDASLSVDSSMDLDEGVDRRRARGGVMKRGRLIALIGLLVCVLLLWAMLRSNAFWRAIDSRPVVNVLVWTRLEPFLDYDKDWWTEAVEFDPTCRVRCLWGRDKDGLDDADAVVFHGPSADDCMWPEKKGNARQRWVYLSIESPLRYPMLERHTSKCDWKMTFEQDSEVTLTYYSPEWDSDEAWYGPHFQLDNVDPDLAPVVGVISFCGGKRNEQAAELMKHIKVDMYGKCHHNKDEIPGDDKMSIISRYPFCLAWENTNATDYVSEKLLQPYIAGVVPIYMGAPNAADYVPGGFIHVADFPDMRSVAEEIRRLLRDKDAYNALFEWKKAGTRSRRMVELQSMTAYAPHASCRLCERLFEYREGL